MDLRDGTLWGEIADTVITALIVDIGEIDPIDLEQIVQRLLNAKLKVVAERIKTPSNT